LANHRRPSVRRSTNGSSIARSMLMQRRHMATLLLAYLHCPRTQCQSVLARLRAQRRSL
jgi:hypothetical protein